MHANIERNKTNYLLLFYPRDFPLNFAIFRYSHHNLIFSYDKNGLSPHQYIIKMYTYFYNVQHAYKHTHTR